MLTWLALAAATAAQPNLPEVEICLGDGIVDVSVGLYPHVRCAIPCEGALSTCVQEEVDPSTGGPLKQLHFTVDGVAGEFRYNRRPNLQAAVLVHPGGRGTDWIEDDRTLWQPLQEEGVMVIGVRWSDRVIDPFTQTAWGWLAKTRRTGRGYVTATARTAAVVDWLRFNLVPPGVPFGAVGHSNGGLALMGAAYWHGAHENLDYLLLNSPSAEWDLQESCKAYTGKDTALGVCEQDPGIACTTDRECGGKADRCALPVMSVQKAHRIDYLMDTNRACEAGLPHPALREASIRRTQGERVWDLPVDVVVSEGGKPDGDTARGITWHAGHIFNGLDTRHPKGKRWFDFDGYGHGGAAVHPDLVWQLEHAIRRAFDLPKP